MKHTYVYKGTKRAIVLGILDKTYSIEYAAQLARVKPATIKRWIPIYTPEVQHLSNRK